MRLITSIHRSGVADACAAIVAGVVHYWHSLGLNARRQYLLHRIRAARFDQIHNAQAIQLAMWLGQGNEAARVTALVASDEDFFAALQRHVDRIETALWPVRVRS